MIFENVPNLRQTTSVHSDIAGTAGCRLPPLLDFWWDSVEWKPQRESICERHFNNITLTENIYLLICSIVVCPDCLRLQKRPLSRGCCDLRCTSIALLSKSSRALQRALMRWAWATDTAKPVRPKSSSASCPTLSQPGIPLGSGVMSSLLVPLVPPVI